MAMNKKYLNEKYRILTYDIKSYPDKFDLVQLLLRNEKVIPGWWEGGNNWGGYRATPEMKVVGWKRMSA